MFIYPEQKIETDKKDKKWRVANVDYIINDGFHERYDDVARMIDNYNLVNSQLNQDDYRELCEGLDLSMEDGRKYVEAYNKAYNIYSTLKGEELSRPFNYRIANMSPGSADEILSLEEFEFRRMVDTKVNMTIERVQKEVELMEKMEQGSISAQQFQSQQEKMNRELQRRYGDLLDPKKIKSKFKGFMTTKEKTINKLIRIIEKRLNLKWVKNETFGDAIIAGKEFVEVRFEKEGDLPIVRQLNPLNVFYHKSPDTPFIHDSDYAGYVEELTIGDVIDLYGDKMHPDDLKRLQMWNYDGSGAYGTSDTFFHTRQDVHASSWNAKRQAGMFPSGRDIDPHALMVLDGKYMAVPGSGRHHSGQVYGAGLYNNQYVYRRPYAVVYTVYWKSFRKLVKYEYEDESGTLRTELADDSFYIPEDAKKETYQTSMFGPDKIRKVWYDEDGKFRSAEEIWIEEVWKGKRINGDIYLDIEPLEHAYQSLLNPYKSKLPIFGYIYNARNTINVGPIDRVKPWQKLYYVVMAKFLKLITQDKGVWTFLNTLWTDDELGWEETLRMGQDLGLIPFNPLAHSEGGQLPNTFKVAEKLDLSNAGSVQYYIQLLEFIESQMKESAQMSDTRLAQMTTTQRTATETQATTASSFTMTEPFFSAHDLLWEHVMQSLMEKTISALNDKDNKIRGFLDDDEITILDLSLVSLEDEYLLKVMDNSKSSRILDQSKNLAMSLIQNDKAKLSTLIDLLRTEDVSEFNQHLKMIESQIEEREEMMQKRQEDLQREMMDREDAIREDEQKAKLDDTYLKGLFDEKREHTRGKYMVTSYNLQNDSNQNAIPDILEHQMKYEDLLNTLEKTKKELELKDRELAQREKEHNENLEESRKNRESQDRLKRQEMASKERIEKAKARTNPTSNS